MIFAAINPALQGKLKAPCGACLLEVESTKEAIRQKSYKPKTEEEKMKSKSVLIEGYQSVIDNGRNHSVVTDLPKGTNLGASALELTVMSLAGCISTIFKTTAEKMRLNVEKVEVDMDAEKGNDTISKVTYKVHAKSDASDEQLRKCLDLTLKNCPVGVLFEKAGVEIEGKLEKI